MLHLSYLFVIFLLENTGKVVIKYGVGRKAGQDLEETFQLIQIYRKTSRIKQERR